MPGSRSGGGPLVGCRVAREAIAELFHARRTLNDVNQRAVAVEEQHGLPSAIGELRCETEPILVSNVRNPKQQGIIVELIRDSVHVCTILIADGAANVVDLNHGGDSLPNPGQIPDGVLPHGSGRHEGHQCRGDKGCNGANPDPAGSISLPGPLVFLTLSAGLRLR